MLMLAVALLGQLGGSSDLRRTMAAGSEDAVLMFPPETVCGSETVDATWTGEGKQLVVVRKATDFSPRDVAASLTQKTAMRPAIKNELIVWDLRTRKAKTILSLPAENASIGELEPVPGSDRVIVGLFETVRDASGAVTGQSETVGMLSAATSTLVRISSHTSADPFFDQAIVSPSKPIVVLRRMMSDRSGSTVRFMTANGRVTGPFSFPFKSPIGFDNSGDPGLIIRQDTAAGKMAFKFHKLNPLTGQELGVIDFVPPKQKKPDEKMVAQWSNPAIGGGATTPTILLQLKGGKDDESGVVSTDGVRPEISPNRDAIVYVSQGSTMVRVFATVPRSAYDQSKLAAEKAVAISNGKQLGLALILFGSDMDDTLPGQDVDIRSKLEPYTKNSKLFENFTYTFGGGSMTSIEQPASTQVGYVTGPGGRAVIFADGHVKWQSDAP